MKISRISIVVFSAILLTGNVFSQEITEDLPNIVRLGEMESVISEVAVASKTGLKWPIYDPAWNKSAEYTLGLYDGNAGIILFYAEAGTVLNNKKYLNKAKEGAEYLFANFDNVQGEGLYSGMTGVAYAFSEAAAITGDNYYLDCYQKIMDRMYELDRNENLLMAMGNDIISGCAGSGLFFLYAYEKYNDEKALKVAEKAAFYMIANRMITARGYFWYPGQTYLHHMPNFSHGTAGVSYFLARMYEVTGESSYLDAAKEGARYLEAIADKGDGTFKVMHTEGNDDLYYLGWCHGPTGTMRLFVKLYQLTGDKHWFDLVNQCAQAIKQSPIFEYRSMLLHNNGLCCGFAGVAECFLGLYDLTGDLEHLDYAEKLVNKLTEEIYPDNELHTGQVGHMQGLSGMALTYLHYEEVKAGMKIMVNLPDSPWNKGRYFDISIKKIRPNKAQIVRGNDARFTAVVSNELQSWSEAAKVKFFLTKKAKSSGKLPKEIIYLGEEDVEELAPGKKKKLKVGFSIPANAKRGSYFVVAQYDPESQTSDCNTKNSFLISNRRLTIK